MACLSDATLTDFGCIPNNPIGFVEKFYSIGLGFIGATALIFIMYGGYLMLTSKGNPIQLAKGKRYLYSSISGLLLAIFSLVYIQTIGVDILKIPGISR